MKPKILASTHTRVECELHADHPVRLVHAAGRRLLCMEGVAWITAQGQPVDVFLRAGHSYVVPDNGLVLAEAVDCCRLQVELPRAFDYAPLLMRFLAPGWLRGAVLSVRHRAAA